MLSSKETSISVIGSDLSSVIVLDFSESAITITSKFLDKKVIGQVGSEQYLNSKYGLK